MCICNPEGGRIRGAAVVVLWWACRFLSIETKQRLVIGPKWCVRLGMGLREQRRKPKTKPSSVEARDRPAEIKSAELLNLAPEEVLL